MIRAGLTPKFRDIETLCKMLEYKCGAPDILQGEQGEVIKLVDGERSIGKFECASYSPPIRDFLVTRFSISRERKEEKEKEEEDSEERKKTKYLIEGIESGSIWLALEGEGGVTGRHVGKEGGKREKKEVSEDEEGKKKSPDVWVENTLSLRPGHAFYVRRGVAVEVTTSSHVTLYRTSTSNAAK